MTRPQSNIIYVKQGKYGNPINIQTINTQTATTTHNSVSGIFNFVTKKRALT